MDVHGWNYIRIGDMDNWHRKHPKIPIVGSEEASTICTRGIYANDPARGYVSAHEANLPGWGSTAEAWWTFYAARPYVAGGFIWSGFDYRGEPDPYPWPCINSHYGVLDTCGFPKDNMFYYKSWWTDEPVLHIFPHWNWEGREGQEIDVRCFSNFRKVELFLNGRSLGAREMPRHSHVAWKVIYESGTLEARGTSGKRLVKTARIETTGAPAKLSLVPDRAVLRADGEDVSSIAVAILDAQDRVVPTAGNVVHFDIKGNGTLLGVGNGDPSSHESDKASHRRAFNGLCMVLVQSTRDAGPIVLTARSERLASARLTLRARVCTPRTWLG